jgi:hypothetical protein
LIDDISTFLLLHPLFCSPERAFMTLWDYKMRKTYEWATQNLRDCYLICRFWRLYCTFWLLTISFVFLCWDSDGWISILRATRQKKKAWDIHHHSSFYHLWALWRLNLLTLTRRKLCIWGVPVLWRAAIGLPLMTDMNMRDMAWRRGGGWSWIW